MRGQLGRLCAVLFLAKGDTVPTDELVGWVLGDPLPTRPVDQVHVLVSRLRRSLDASPERAKVISGAAGYRVETRSDAVDAWTFEALLADVQHAPGPRRAVLSEALSWWAGEPVEGLGLAHHPAVERLRSGYDDAWDERFRLECEAGELGRLAEAVSRSRERPEREQLAATVVTALGSAGRQRDALVHFHHVHERLRKEFGLDPSPLLLDAERQILEQTAIAPRETGLPVWLRGFVGRADELARVEEAVEANPLVTLWGPGGVGKTRLAVEYAHRRPGQAWFVDLSLVTTPADVPRAVAEALGIDVGLRDPTGDAVLRALSRRAGLLLLDNCEHLLPVVAPFAAAAASANDLRVIATSREPLGVQGEVVVPLGPLRPDDQRALFLAAAPQGPEYVDEHQVMAICSAVEGLPLAIELAASQLRSVPAEELLRSIHDGLDVLAAPRLAPARHGSMTAMLDTSFDTLSPAERRVFSAMWIFLGSFDAAAAHAVLGAGGRLPETLQSLRRLADRSLLQVDHHHGAPEASGRFRLLEPVRQYSRAKTIDPRLPEAHAAHVTNWLDQLNSSGRAAHERAELIDADLANLRGAVGFLIDNHDDERLGRVVTSLSTYAELRPSHDLLSWATTYLTRTADRAPAAAVIRAHLIAGWVLHANCAWPESETHYRAAVALAEKLGSSKHRDSALIGLVSPVGFQGRFDECVEIAATAIDYAVTTGDPMKEVVARCVHAWAAVHSERATEIDLEALALHARAATSPAARAYACSGWTAALLATAHPDAAERGCAAIDAADRIRHVHMQCLHRSLLPLAEESDPVLGALLGVRTALVLYPRARLPFGIRQLAAEAIPALGTLERWTDVALLAGAAAPTSVRPADVDRAKHLAASALGADAYDHAVRHGRRLDQDAFLSYLTQLLDDLRVPAVATTIP